MSADNALIYVDNIRDALIKYDPANAQTYRQNAALYKEKIRQTMAPAEGGAGETAGREALAGHQRRRVLLSGPRQRLKERYLWPINADQQGTPQQVRKTIDIMKKEHIPTIFSESTISDKPARQVAREAGAHYGGVLYVDSLSTADGPVPTYLDLLRVTTQTIVQGINDGMRKQP